MILKKRVESEELKLLKYLNARTSLSKKDQKSLIASEKGYQGEGMFDEWALPLENELAFLNDLLLEHQGSIFQIDSCALASKTIFHFEVKNFEGDYQIKNGNWISPSGEEKKDPLIQLKRTSSLIRQYTQQLGFHYNVESYLIFINPEFYLYNAPDNPSIIYHPQLNRFMNNLQSRSLKVSKSDLKLAEKLRSQHILESPYLRLPKYSFEDLQKGILCPGCHGFYEAGSGVSLVCHRCGQKELKTAAIVRTVEEFILLFPEEKLTTNKIQVMCGIISDKKVIRKALSRHFTMKGYGKHSYYLRIKQNESYRDPRTLKSAGKRSQGSF
ncbi:NERD domain-containing protein [Rossellomorea vietnamensis]|uniref:NERD domain-containing protein n=1 Tax=Rossellomorea vietnamensis TaxID=218284 RepID=A0A5D4M6V0_9BACI|nr:MULTISPECIES: nuclease-related domain-containing protein [Bacillaceae]TYR97629.1 NERD domain-containing protein [Rossellomorea vietnamensis]